jgi:hypothetical protein
MTEGSVEVSVTSRAGAMLDPVLGRAYPYPGRLSNVVQPIGQLARFDAKTFGEFLDRRQPRLASATLDPADAGQVDP